MICNANSTIDRVRNVPLVRPNHAGKVWQGIKHGELVDAVIDECQARNWTVEKSQFSLSVDGADLAGAFALRIPNVELPAGQGLELGFLTSNMMRRKLKLVVGTRVFVCNNGMVSGDIVLNHKHTNRFDLYESLETAMDCYYAKALEIPGKVRALQQRDLAEPEVEHLLISAGRAGLMPWSRIGQVDQEFRHPTFGDHAGRSSWSLLNAFTHVVKKCPALTQMDQINGFRELLPVQTGNN